MELELWPWVTLLLLGGLHGVNPGMGWLFAVALGLQGGSGRAVLRALPPLALGHAAAIGAVAALALLVGVAVPQEVLKWTVASLLLGVGVLRLVRARHPRFGGMKVGPRDLSVWSFLMASAHGAGLMVLPVLLGMRARAGQAAAALGEGVLEAAHGGHAATAVQAGQAGAAMAAQLPDAAMGHASHVAPLVAGLSESQLAGLAATGVHTLGYLLVTALVALVVYHRFGVRLLRTHWINLDVIWAAALVLTALATPLL
jgi:hypothetical protein